MSQHEYLRLLEREIHRINKVIDYKIIHGEEYAREARDHKLLLRKVRHHTASKNFFNRMFPFLFQY